jgi:hypothetical protein
MVLNGRWWWSMTVLNMTNPKSFGGGGRDKCSKTSVPVVMEGDFNLIRERSDNNNQNLNFQ